MYHINPGCRQGVAPKTVYHDPIFFGGTFKAYTLHMRRIETYFVLWFFATSLFWVSPVLGATITATNASLSAVQAAVNSASVGDTVNVPAGGAIWAGALRINKGINLIGAGTNATFITNGVNGSFLITVTLSAGTAFRISGFCFDHNWSSGGGGINVVAKVYQPFYNDVNGFRIDHCVFRNSYYNYGLPDTRPIQLSGRVWGVIDHCRFTDNVSSFAIEGCPWSPNTYPTGPNGDQDWAYSPGPPYYRLGSTNTVVFEDCVFSVTASMPASPGVFILGSSRWTASYVIRHCTISDSVGRFGDLFDLHGNQDSRGAITCEIYNNTVNATANLWRLVHLRGGTCMVFSNTMTGGGAANIEINEEETYRTDLVCLSCYPSFGPIDLTYPKHDQVTNSFFWANTMNGSQVNPMENPGMAAAAPGWFREGRDYWTHAPNNTNVLKDYKPLVYPHPLVTDVGQTNPVILSTSFNAADGTIISPFVINADNTLSQSVTTTNPTAGGRAAYSFYIPVAATNYCITAAVTAPSDSANSFFVNIDAEPVSPDNIWTIPVYAGVTNRLVTWGTNTEPQAWSLNAGTHQLVIRGRAANTKAGAFRITPPPSTPRVVGNQ
jgi:hypothetical protein